MVRFTRMRGGDPKHRRELRKDEQAFRDYRYKIEDAILAEKEAAAADAEAEEETEA